MFAMLPELGRADMVLASELPIDIGATAMANKIFGCGVTVVRASYTGDNKSSGIYTNGDTVWLGVTPADSGVILSTGHATDFTNSGGNANQRVNSGPGFNALAGTHTYGAAMLDVDFIPAGDTLTMQFVLSGVEYPGYFSRYTDTIGVWINGTEVPLLVGNGTAGVNDVNPANNINLHTENTSRQFNAEKDGFNVAMSLTIPVNSGQLNSIRVGITDVGVSPYDSNLLIAGDSMETALVAEADSADIETNSFTYTVASSTGAADTGIVTPNIVPCFVAGTMVLTPEGERAVETLAAGDRVITYDAGTQRLRWVGRRRVAATGDFAPILIAKGSFGTDRDLLVSPQHRILIRDSLAELLFGEGEVLIAAKDLINGRTVRRQEGAMVDYVHILFDRHQVVYSNGMPTEIFRPGPQIENSFDAEVVHDICSIFPELDPDCSTEYSAPARRTLREYEARVLMWQHVAA